MAQLSINLKEAALLSIILDAQGWADREVYKGKPVYYLSKGKILNELPLVFKDKNTVRRYLVRLEQKGLIKRIHDRKTGRLYFEISLKADAWDTYLDEDELENINNQYKNLY